MSYLVVIQPFPHSDPYPAVQFKTGSSHARTLEFFQTCRTTWDVILLSYPSLLRILYVPAGGNRFQETEGELLIKRSNDAPHFQGTRLLEVA